MRKYAIEIFVIVAMGATLTACGGDDDDDSTPQAGTGGQMVPVAGGGGVSGAGAGGMGGSGGSTATAAPMPVVCGSTTCQSGLGGLLGMFGGAIPGGGAGLLPAACCLDEASSTCGQSMNGGACMALPPPPMFDPTCPGASAIGMMMQGCCIDGQCGVDASMLGMGCQENSVAKMNVQALPGIGSFIMIPDPRPCGQPPDDMMMMDQDAGM